jgi:hypothetical protein
MLILFPIGFLLVAALVITILDRVRPKFGTAWLIATGASVIAWLLIFILRLRLPTTLPILTWEGSDLNLLGHFSLILDYQSWPYALALATLSLAVILTGAARTRYDSTPRAWAASLTITALGLLALQAGTSLTMMVAWVIADLFELIYLLRLAETPEFNFRIILSYGVRMTSILMLFMATMIGWQSAGSFDLNAIPQNAAIFFLLAAGLRLGVLPLNLPFLQEPVLRRGGGNILRLAPVASSLVLLVRLPENVLPANLEKFSWVFFALLAIAALYAAFRWLSAKDEIEGRPYWIVAWASLATVSVLNGQPQSSLPWGLTLLLPGSLLFLYYPRVQRMNFLLYFGLIGLIGLPYTPLASGWLGLAGSGFNLWTIFFVLAHTLMVLGYINRVLAPGGEAGALESWARVVYPLGLIIIIQAILTLGLIGWPGSLTIGLWWLPLISIILAVAAFVLVRKLGISAPYLQLPASSWLNAVLEWITPRIEPIFRLEWLYQILWSIYTFAGKILQVFSKVLEGEGGILWTILLLLLLISAFASGGFF